MKIEVTKIPQPKYRIVLEMDEREVAALRVVAGYIGGDPGGFRGTWAEMLYQDLPDTPFDTEAAKAVSGKIYFS